MIFFKVEYLVRYWWNPKYL